MMPITRAGYVYIIYAPFYREVKIGFSGNPEQRIKQIRSGYFNCEDAYLVAVKSVPNGDYEMALHQMFSDLRTEDVQDREWFKPTETMRALIHSEEGWTIYNELIVEALL